ncbi:hypothetical protein BOTBODRAFT_114602 [Botryobasidium botryosum FD-172 SS1]|uniref:Bicarbonate transporter-like transmembrane domain-containing protein n=1 Tax=Botryobasidium botryosum (strain FD-172 SS1) TaxID=930990 RepID=A0A067M6I3_BOTB1|nr:hypothetical protein BOTBODRAFT_114602 [Botryobasidium botryosum FD-172 SS1]
MLPFQGIWRDINARGPYYLSDWTDAWTYRVIPATLLMFCANVLPALAFSLDLIEKTGEYGVTEILFASFLGAAVFSLFSAQPLTITGVTGPITVLNYTIFTVIPRPSNGGPLYLGFIAWVYIWSAIMHFIIAISNGCNALVYFTLFPCDAFGFYVGWIYMQYGVQIVSRQSATDAIDATLLSVVLAVTMFSLSWVFKLTAQSKLFHPLVRRMIADYGMMVAFVACSALPHWGRLRGVHLETLPTTGVAFTPQGGRNWIVPFWDVPAKWVGIAIPFAILLTILFYFDHNVSSLMAQSSAFPLRKPPGFHLDFFMLGVTTFLAGILGIPAPNGLIPQAPIHTRSLLIFDHIPVARHDAEKVDPVSEEAVSHGVQVVGERAIGVVEQRLSNLAQGGLTLLCMIGPILHQVIGRIPKGVLAGLFWYMGSEALLENGITAKLSFLLGDARLILREEPLLLIRRKMLWLWVFLLLIGFAGTFAITQTIAAIGFPFVICLMIPLRTWLVPKMGFTPAEIDILDQPVASDFVYSLFLLACTKPITDVALF